MQNVLFIGIFLLAGIAVGNPPPLVGNLVTALESPQACFARMALGSITTLQRQERARRVLHYYRGHPVNTELAPTLSVAGHEAHAVATIRAILTSAATDFSRFEVVPLTVERIWELADRSELSVDNIAEIIGAFADRDRLLDMRLSLSEAVELLLLGLRTGNTFPVLITLFTEAFTGIVASRPNPETDARFADRARWSARYLQRVLDASGDWRRVLREGFAP